MEAWDLVLCVFVNILQAICIVCCFAALFYYTLGNISPMYRSRLKSIQLLAITKSSVLQAYGADCILKNVMEDVKQLEQVRLRPLVI